MTTTRNRPPTTGTDPGSPTADRAVTRGLLTAGAAAGPLFLTAGLTQALTRDGFDLTRNALSQLSLGALGWIQVAVFLLTGALAVAGAVGTRRALRGGPGGVWAPRLIGVFGASFLVAGIFRADPGHGFPPGTPDGAPASMSAEGSVHMAAATLGFLALCAAFLVLGRFFAAEGRRGYALASRVVPVVVLAGSSAAAVSMPAFTASAGLGLLWLTAVALRLTDRR
ncbi:hypothetical protein GCM10023347_26650 [Streptomyces chumphonensis]|uniref:DUF998 domain-containing protein n=1 Tax=Streptomyces chumphonensis TaxID=1214925 RepID=A0A927IDN1_9ACTN|nr:DUF998 domain-containing protein [Streptomyces chumphonensis]MBD3932476.1 DUF998 domain-containing protein [Streptomyces chumphonensis]